jgi:DNA invertase Pin-like site-specific DNA recombinase
MITLNSDESVRAAQYLRMSSDNQRYSLENQQNAIAEYARERGFSIVASYIDAGKSGLSLKGRDALKQLLSDALAAERAFDAILVLDVSRWGRFQNPDQAAHYEFLCRQAGVRVVYCGEPFGEDLAPTTTIIKHLKRVMAGEYSRELSAKLSRAHHQQARLGFRQGGKMIYGFRRLLVDAAGNPRQVLNRGGGKALSSDKVMVIPGPPEELAVIRRIFRLYVHNELSIPRICTRLVRSGVTGYDDKPLGHMTVRNILSDELCIGQLTYNTTTKKLQSPTVKTPEHLWIRVPVFDPIVTPSLFRKAQERLSRAVNPVWDHETIIASLRSLLARKGRLSTKLVDEAKDTPCWGTVISRFGSLKAAYRAAGFQPPDRKHWSREAVLAGLRKLHAAEGHVSTGLIRHAPALPSPELVRRYFGSVPDALREAGLPDPTPSRTQSETWQRRKAAEGGECFHRVRWTDAALLRALRQLYERYGYITISLLDRNGDTPSSAYYIKRFGSIARARTLAKVPVPTRSEIMSAARQRMKEGTVIGRGPRHAGQRPQLWYRSDAILLGLKRLAERAGRVSSSLINEDPGLPSAPTFVTHFGSLTAAYELAGLVRLPGRPPQYGLPPAPPRPKRRARGSVLP